MTKQSANPSYLKLLEDSTHILYSASPTPRIDSEVLMQHVIQQPLSWLFAYGDTVATSEQIKVFFDLVSQRQQGKPIAYLIGYRDFWSLRLKVNEDVLIPRPDTETLVEQALEKLAKVTHSQVLDLGTGSGAIALAIAKERKDTTVIATDYHTTALGVARENASLNKVNNVQFRQSNWYSNIASDEKFDLIASNPPYVESGDPHLEQGDLRFEPPTALISPDAGLGDLTQVIHGAIEHLKHEAWLIVEHGYNQAVEVAQLFTSSGYHNIELYKDLNGLARCTAGQFTANQESIIQ